MKAIPFTLVNVELAFESSECCVCGVIFAMPATLKQKFEKTGDWFYCPSGHSQRYAVTENVKLRNQLLTEQDKVVALEKQVRDLTRKRDRRGRFRK